MEAACRRTAEHFRFRSPRISHSVAVLVLGLAFYSEDPDGVGYTINIFLFPYLSPSAGSEAALLAHRWDVILGGRRSHLLCGHKPVACKSEGGARHQLGGGDKANIVLGGVLPCLHRRHGCAPSHIGGLQSPRGDQLRRGTAEVPDTDAANLACRPPLSNTNRVQRELPSGVGEATEDPIAIFRAPTAGYCDGGFPARERPATRGVHAADPGAAGPTSDCGDPGRHPSPSPIKNSNSETAGRRPKLLAISPLAGYHRIPTLPRH